MQEACAGTLKGAKLTIAPEGMANMYALMGSGLLTGGRPGLLPALTGFGPSDDAAPAPTAGRLPK